eukprot:Tbor_TRINITY_DN5750_c3_g8::TRINITY_DN5750_c3_g8_i1::g.19540::m.19540
MAPSKKQQTADLRSVKKHAVASVNESKKSAKAALNHKENKKQPATQKGSKKATNVVSDMLAVADNTGGRPEPPYRYEIHVKKAQVLVDVTLHKVPHQHIDISQCTTRSLIVDCKKHTKPYRLEFELPHKMTMDPEKATYTFENGVLKCVIQCDRISPEAEKERHEFIEKVTAAKSLRFRMSKEGEVVVRTRKSKLNMTPTTKSSVSAAKGKDEDENGASPKTTKNINKNNDKNDKPVAKITPMDTDKNQQKSKGKLLVSDDRVASLAASAVEMKTTKMSLSDKIKASKQELLKREQRQASRSARKEKKKEIEEGAFGRILSEQQRKLREREVLSAPVQKSTSGKRIAFA